MELWFSEYHAPDVKHSIRVNRHLYSKRSEYQQIDILDTPEFGKVLALDGNVILTERDEFVYDEISKLEKENAILRGQLEAIKAILKG